MNNPKHAPLLIGLVGFTGAGKDTLADALEELGWTRSAFADPMKEFLLRVDPYYEETKGPNGSALRRLERCKRAREKGGGPLLDLHWNYTREKLQNLGMLFREEVDEDFWVKKTMSDERIGPKHVFTDVRFMNEAVAIMKAGGHIVAVERPGYGEVNDHASEKGTAEVLNIAQAVVMNNRQPSDLCEAFLQIITVLG